MGSYSTHDWPAMARGSIGVLTSNASPISGRDSHVMLGIEFVFQEVRTSKERLPHRGEGLDVWETLEHGAQHVTRVGTTRAGIARSVAQFIAICRSVKNGMNV
jgi:hypothetical protein